MTKTATPTATILTLRLRAEHDGLIVANRTWPADVANSAPVAEAIDTGDYDTVSQALGTPETVTLTGDGRGAAPDTWCRCAPSHPEPQPVRYERWTRAGRVAHGYVCPHVTCRRLVQSG